MTRRQPVVTIRAVSLTDAEAVAELINLPGYRWGTMRLPYQTPEQVRQRIGHAGADSLGLVALADGKIVGNAGLERMIGRRAHVGRIGMGVSDAWTGRGIGRHLLQALVDTAERWMDLRRLELTVWTDNAPALALYRRFGFVIEGTHQGYAFRDGRYVDAHTMARVRLHPDGAGPLPGQD